MKTINAGAIKKQLNKCYMDYDPEWTHTGDVRISGFKYHVEHTAGIKLYVVPAKDRMGRLRYEIKQAEIVNDPKFTMWLLRWS